MKKDSAFDNQNVGTGKSMHSQVARPHMVAAVVVDVPSLPWALWWSVMSRSIWHFMQMTGVYILTLSFFKPMSGSLSARFEKQM